MFKSSGRQSMPKPGLGELGRSIEGTDQIRVKICSKDWGYRIRLRSMLYCLSRMTLSQSMGLMCSRSATSLPLPSGSQQRTSLEISLASHKLAILDHARQKGVFQVSTRKAREKRRIDQAIEGLKKGTCGSSASYPAWDAAWSDHPDRRRAGAVPYPLHRRQGSHWL